ncbi:10753_t:CDS:2, partial [Entrophospora sp. SA101]
DYKLFEDTDSNPSEVTDSELVQFNLSETDVDCMSEEEAANQAVEEDLITLEEENNKQSEITPYLILSESDYTSGGGSSKTTEEEEPTGSNQEKDSIKSQESKEENEDTDSEEGDETASNSTISDRNEDFGSEEYNQEKDQTEESTDNSKIIQEPILSYYIDSDQESETGRLYVKNIPSSEEASPEKKNKEKETVSPIISAPSSPLQGRSEEGKEIQLSGISTNLRVMTTTINLNPTIKDILTGIPSVEIGPTGGGILGKLEKALGEYDCWAPGCKNKVRGKYTKCQTCNKCEHEGCTKETENQSRWCGDCWLRCKRPYCFRVGRIGGNNCSEHQSEEPVPCAWMGCGNKSENNRGYCQACQDKSDEMCDTPKCYQPRCKNSDLYCQECWEKNMKGIKGNTTMKSTTKGISSNITTGSGNSGEPAYKCLLNACIKKVEEYGEKCPNHRHCEHEGYEAYCYNHRTKEKTQCAVVNCHEKAGGRAWEYCDKCCTDIATLGQVTGCDEHDTNNLSCSKCRKIDIFKEYNEIRKEALKAKNVTFYALNKTKPSTSYVELPTFDGAGEDPYHWWKSFNDACNANNISLERRLQIVPSFLKGQANVWWKMASPFTTVWEVPRNGVNEHVSFKKQFFDYFCTQFHRQNWMEQLRSREQMAHEDVDAYAGALADLYQKVDPLNRYPEEDKMQQFLKGLQPAIRMLTELNTPNNWNEAWQQAKKVENALKRGSIGNPLLQPANVNQALINQMAKMEETIQVLHTEVKENKETCTNCNRKGHVAKNCYAKSIKYNDVPQKPCHNCGRKGHWTKDCYASKQCNNCNGKGHLAKDCNKGVKCYGCGNFGHIAKECQKKKKSQDKRNNNNSQSYNGRPRRQNAYISQEEDTLSTLAATVGELAKKVENLKGDGSAKNTNEHPQTVPDCVTCDAEIWGTKVKAIVDTGSSGSIISKQCLDQLKRKIEESSNVSLIGINGQKHRPLGIVRNVHVTLDNKHPIEVTMQVTEATNYELILGVDWLRAINGVISIGEKILITTAYGTTNKHPIKVEKKPNIIEQPGDEEYEEESIQEEFAFLNRMITDHKPEQMIRTFTNIEWEDLEEEQKPTINRELTLKQQQKLDKFLQKHDDMFAGGLYELGHTQEEGDAKMKDGKTKEF